MVVYHDQLCSGKTGSVPKIESGPNSVRIVKVICLIIAKPAFVPQEGQLIVELAPSACSAPPEACQDCGGHRSLG